jgi:hypothetical protein
MTMAAMPQALLVFDQPKPKFVPKPTAPQGIVLETTVARRVKVHTGRGKRPKHVLLGTINHADFRVVRAIPVNLDVRGNTVLASWRQIDEFGTGKTTSLALDELGHTLAELFDALQKDEARLGPDLINVWATLKEHIVRRTNEIPRV